MHSVFIFCLLVNATTGIGRPSLLYRVYKTRSAVLDTPKAMEHGALAKANCVSWLYRPYYHLINSGYFGNPSAGNIASLKNIDCD